MELELENTLTFHSIHSGSTPKLKAKASNISIKTTFSHKSQWFQFFNSLIFFNENTRLPKP